MTTQYWLPAVLSLLLLSLSAAQAQTAANDATQPATSGPPAAITTQPVTTGAATQSARAGREPASAPPPPAAAQPATGDAGATSPPVPNEGDRLWLGH